jgi:hypothetical protein
VDCQSGFFPDEISPKRNQKLKIEKDVVLEIFNHQVGGGEKILITRFVYLVLIV